jgi:hypothetical protein
MKAAVQSALSLRRRSGWEAADTGILLWQKNWPALLLFFGVPYGILTLAAFFLPANFITATGIVLWWLKPFFDRFALHVIAIRFFEPGVRFGRLFKGLGKTLRRALAGDLIWRRFSPFRSSRMPILVLEGLKGKALKKRRDTMSPRGLYFGFPVTVICFILDMILTYGEIIFIYGVFDLIQPGYLSPFLEWIAEENTKILLVVSWFNLIFVETLFVCMGFGLYINARVETEGWDIELLFKKCTEKAKTGGMLSSTKIKTGVCLAMIVFFVPLKSFAQNTKPPAVSAEQFEIPPLSEGEAKSPDDVLSSEAFGYEKPSWKIQLKKDIDFDPDLQWRDLKFPRLKEALGIAIRAVLVIAFLFILIWSARYFYRRRFLAPKKTGNNIYGTAGGTDDPEELLESAGVFYREGKIREAWALCFRAFIAAFGRRWGITFPPEATEYEALKLAGDKNEAFPLFVSRWINFAYGGKNPGTDDFDNALLSCRRMLETENVQEEAGA